MPTSWYHSLFSCLHLTPAFGSSKDPVPKFPWILFKSDGIGGLYRGFSVSCVHVFAFLGLRFGVLDYLQKNSPGSHVKLDRAFLLASGVWVTSAVVCYPLDTILRRMMMTSGEATQYKGSAQCAFYIIKNEGVKSMMRGVGAYIPLHVANAAMAIVAMKLCVVAKKLYTEWR